MKKLLFGLILVVSLPVTATTCKELKEKFIGSVYQQLDNSTGESKIAAVYNRENGAPNLFILSYLVTEDDLETRYSTGTWVMAEEKGRCLLYGDLQKKGLKVGLIIYNQDGTIFDMEVWGEHTYGPWYNRRKKEINWSYSFLKKL